MRKYLLNFANHKFRFAQKILSSSAKPYFDEIIEVSPANIEEHFLKANEEILSHSMGNGYWLWKPYFILRALLSINDNDILFYIDSGNEIISDVTPLFKLLDDCDVALFKNRDVNPRGEIWINSTWTKADCFNLMGCCDDKFKKGYQVNAGYIFLRKTPLAVKLIQEFLSHSCNKYIITDSANVSGHNEPDFIAHRHDQSILSLLAIKHDIGLHDDPSQFANHVATRPYPQILNHFRTQIPSKYIEELRQNVESIPFWYHRIDLPGGVLTPGLVPVDPSAYGIPESLRGLRVLDVGAWDGYWTFEALKRGAREVVAIDDYSDERDCLKNNGRCAWEKFDLCRQALGYDEHACKRLDLSVYDATEEKLGRFDVVFLFGAIYRLRHPLLALDRLSAICDREIYVESAILDDFSPYRGGYGHGYPDNEMVMEFYPGQQYGNADTNWWVPTLRCLEQMVLASGFAQARSWKLPQEPGPALSSCRGFVKAAKTPFAES